MQDRLSRLGLAFACVMVAALLAVAAVGLLGAALFLALSSVVSQPLALLLTAGISLFLAMIVLLIGRTISSRQTRRSRDALPGTGGFAKGGVLGLMAQDVGREAGSLVGEHAGKAILAALLAGFVVGVSPRLRRALWRVLQ